MSQATLDDRPYHNSNLFTRHYLDERLRERDEWDCDDEAREVMEELQSLYEMEGSLVEGYGEDALVHNWIDVILGILEFGTQVEPTLPDGGGFVDELLFESDMVRRDAAEVYLKSENTTDLFERGIGLVEAKQWDADFTERFSKQRPYRNASHQIKHYLENTPKNIQWGILTNGRKWRLYGTKDYETQTYYEVDLPELLEQGDLEAFKYFYVFFRPAAFRESAGTTFLDEVRSESETASQELGKDLQDNVFTALRVLGRGFIETNDLDIDPEDEEKRVQLKNQSLVLLYRLMFVLYAESRGLIHPEDAAALDEYESEFSLDTLRLDIHNEIGEVDEGFADEYSEFSTSMWNRLSNLFQLIDRGEASLEIPPYNGGLFDHDQHDFLTKNEVSDRYLAEVVYRLSTTENGDGRYVLADYADLDTRHLGSVYEGLLEHQFKIAPEKYAAVAEDDGQVWKPATEVTVDDAVETVPEGGFYVANDEGERKATGAYYTPDYVVTYIVEETVGPLVEEMREDLIEQGFEPGTQEYLGPFLRRVTDLKILDPAMGSGHFLTRATGYLAEQVMNEVRDVEDEMGAYWDEQHVRREIAKECIYGVDVNGMAVELAKLSMWLETLAADRPLAFLDHHFKEGDSLVGSDVTEVLANGGDGGEGQLTLYQALARVRQNTLEHVMGLMQDLLAIDNETLEDIKSMEEIYDEIRDDPLYQRLFEVTNVHTAEQFGLDVPEGAYEEMAGAIEDAENWEAIQDKDWFRAAQVMSQEDQYFHWELSFPEVFFNTDGELLENPGFDVVIGNPPYGDILPSRHKDYCRTVGRGFDSERADVFTAFVARAREIVKTGKNIGYILPNTLLRGDQYNEFRQINSGYMKVRSIVDYNDIYVFDVEFYTTIVLFRNIDAEESYLATYITGSSYDQGESPFTFQIEPGTGDHWIPEDPVANSIRHAESTIALSDGLCTCHDAGIDYKVKGQGWQDRGEGVTISDLILYEGEQEHPDDKQYIGGSEITPFHISPEQKWLRHDYESFAKGDEDIVIQVYPDYNEVDEKIVTRQTAHRQDSIIAAVDESQLYTAKSVHTTLLQDESYDIWYVAAILNSRVIDYVYDADSGEQGQTFGQVRLRELRNLPVPEIKFDEDKSAEAEYGRLQEQYEQALTTGAEDLEVEPWSSQIAAHDFLVTLSQKFEELKDQSRAINTHLPDYLGSYSDGPELSELTGFQPVGGVSDTPLTCTTDDYDGLRIKDVHVETSGETIALQTKVRYKPENPDSYKTDRHGFTTTDWIPTAQIIGAESEVRQLLREFVPYVIEEDESSAGYYSQARKSITPLDRIRAITLPKVDEISDRMDDYHTNKKQAMELARKILVTDEFMNQLIYGLYNLGDESIKKIEDEVMVDLRNKIIKGETE